MTSNLSASFILNEGVLIIPVNDLPEEARAKIECDPGDFAVSRLQARNGSKIIDANSAELLARFRQQRTLVEAVILFAREKSLEPDPVLEGAYPFFKSMVDGGFLVPSDPDAAGPPVPPGSGKMAIGSPVLGASVCRTLQVLEDTEVYLLSRGHGSFSVLKIERLSPQSGRPGPVRARLGHEAAFLASLEGSLAPRLSSSNNT